MAYVHTFVHPCFVTPSHRPVTEVELVVQNCEEEGGVEEENGAEEEYEVEVVAPASPELVIQSLEGEPEVPVPLPGELTEDVLSPRKKGEGERGLGRVTSKMWL